MITTSNRPSLRAYVGGRWFGDENNDNGRDCAGRDVTDEVLRG